jgi:hypothetical protein
MAFRLKSPRLLLLAVPIILILLGMASSGYAQVWPDLEVSVGDTTGYPGTKNSVISVYMKNYADTVAGFTLWLRTSMSDKISFQTNLDTLIDTTFFKCIEWDGSLCLDTVIVSWYWVCTNYSGGHCIDSSYQRGYYECTDYSPSVPDSCIDSVFHAGHDWIHVDSTTAMVGNLDTVGTLVSGWKVLQSRSESVDSQDLKITALANTPQPPYKMGILPQYGSVPLVKIMADIKAVAESDTARTVHLTIAGFNLDNYRFTDRAGGAIGAVMVPYVDTSYFRCTSHDPDPPYDCQIWQKVSLPPYDSIDIDTLYHELLDTTLATFTPGSLTVLHGKCGDVTNNGTVDLLDILYLITYKFKGGPPPPVPSLADCDGKQNINLLDILYLITFKFKGGAAPVCLF